MRRLPPWLKQDFSTNTSISVANAFTEFGIHTVCEEAKCPNVNRCFNNKSATFLILGNTCTRNCLFCAVKKSDGNPNLGLDTDEPVRILEIVKRLCLRYIVITSVTRDDLPDGGAGIYARTIFMLRDLKDIKIEVLIPDFGGTISTLRVILEAAPDCIGHNIETVQKLYSKVRPEADYSRSLKILSAIKEIEPAIITKSSVMLGLGESEKEVVETMKDLRLSNCDILTLGQYLAPSSGHYLVKDFIEPEQFKKYEEIGYGLGFKAVLSGPKVRSSYQAEEIFKKASQCMI